MSNQLQPQKKDIKSFFAQENVQAKFKELLGKRAPQFITSVLQITTSSDLLVKADHFSIYNAAAMAATLDLPLNNSLGFAYIVPFNVRQKDGSYKTLAQFQLGAKGFKQLALRSGQFLRLNESDVREGEIAVYDRLSGEIKFNWIQDDKERLSKPIIGYVSYFLLQNGFEHTYYMTIEQLKQHGLKYSQTYKKGFGLWKDDFDSMARKTVIKLNLSKNAPLSVEMQKATMADQAVINDADTDDMEYVDAQISTVEKSNIDKDLERISLLIKDCETIAELENLKPNCDTEELMTMWEDKAIELSQKIQEETIPKK